MEKLPYNLNAIFYNGKVDSTRQPEGSKKMKITTEDIAQAIVVKINEMFWNSEGNSQNLFTKFNIFTILINFTISN